MTNLPIVCRHGLLDQIDGELELLTELCDLFRDYYPDMVGQMRTAIDSADHQGVFQAAHQLKGSLSTLHALRATRTIQSIEDLGRNDSSCLTDARALCHTLELQIAELVDELDRVTTAESSQVHEWTEC